MKRLRNAVGCLVFFGAASYLLAYLGSNCENKYMSHWYGFASIAMGISGMAVSFIVAMETDE